MVEFKQLFYSCAWAHYELARPGSFRLIPPATQIPALARDYGQMQEMIYRDAPEFQAILEALPALEEEINRLS